MTNTNGGDEPISIAELGEDGEAIAVYSQPEIVQNLRVSPWLVALWLLNGFLICFTFVAIYSSFLTNQYYITISGSQLRNETPWYLIVGALASPAMISAFLVLAGTIVLHLFRSEARKSSAKPKE